MPSQAEIAILFADVVGSTELYEKLGDERARAIIRRCLAAMTEVTHHHGGRLLEIVGDEVYTIFPSADVAMAAAVDMQEAITGNLIIDGRRLAIHVGLHFGPVMIGVDGDLYGDAVNVAHRMVNQAKAGQILTTGPTVAATSAQWQATCRLLDFATLKGKSGPVAVFELVWKAEEATLMRRVPLVARTADGRTRLVLAAGSVQTELTFDNPSLTIGRGQENDIVIVHAIVSRLHARAEYRNGRFILTDQSANGTYVVPDRGPASFIHQHDQVLTGSGTLGIGEEPLTGSMTTLRYQATP
jgi:adenylate cyclase